MNLKEYFKHLSIVILGIMIAFWISNIGARIKERTTQKQVLHTILNELKNNNENIKSIILNLDSLQTTFIRIKNKDILTGDISIRYIGITENDIGYETAKYTGILNDVNYKLVSKIVENYESQNALKELEKSMSDELFLIIKSKIGKPDNVDYLLIRIRLLLENLESHDAEQKQLIENLMVFLKIKT